MGPIISCLSSIFALRLISVINSWMYCGPDPPAIEQLLSSLYLICNEEMNAKRLVIDDKVVDEGR